MKILKIQGRTQDSTLLIGERIENLRKYLSAERVIVITDSNVGKRYYKHFPPADIITIGFGEKIKSLDTVQDIYRQLVDLEADRETFIVGIGGGVVCDIAGFVASTFLRGLRFGFVASSLLAQVDAAVGGKNGVNFGGYKNVIGVIRQPEFVVCDMNLLFTLAGREIRCGLAEIIKHAVIADAEMFAYLESNFRQAAGLQAGVIEKLVYDSVVIKAAIVNRDENEKGERRILNFGHTIGHAIEKTTGASHGEAVAAGMAAAASLSVKKGLLPADDEQRIKRLLTNFKLPVRIQTDPDRLRDAIAKDKKRAGNKIHFVLLNALGDAAVEKITLKEIEKLIDGWL